MRDGGPERDSSRPGLIVGLLFLALLLVGVLTWQAQVSMRYHRAAAEKVLRDYASVAADEFARRAVNELGYSGFYPLVTALRQEAGKGRLPSPPELVAMSDETIRSSSDLVLSTLRYEINTRRLEIVGSQPDAATRVWMSERLSEGAVSAPHDGRYTTVHGVVAGVVHSIVFGRVAGEPEAGLAGFEANDGAFGPRFRKALERGPVFPQSLAQGAVKNDVLFLRLLDPSGREVFRAGFRRTPYLGVERPFGGDYNGILRGFVIQAAVDPAAAKSLVIGGLPRSRLPFLLGLLALTSGLILTAVLQLRRERALSQLRSHFVSRVSHELRTPLTQIRMFAETLLLDRVRSEQERRRSLEIIDRESRRLTNLVENVLRFSRGERGEDRVEVQAQDVVPLIRQLLLDFAPLVNGRARLSVRLPERAEALVDEAALRQILLNLLDNAVKYGPGGQEIRLEVETGPERIRISVRDEGPGIAPEERERIWHRFYRLPRDRESAVAGTGIGLSVVRDLTRLLGGRAWVEDDIQRRTRFVVELLAAASPAGVPA